MDKDKLLAPRLDETTVDLTIGQVTVRSLTRSEALHVSNSELDEDHMERVLVAAAMVDPSLTEDDVKMWQDNSPPGEIERVCQVITQISGMEVNAAKDSFPGAGE